MNCLNISSSTILKYSNPAGQPKVASGLGIHKFAAGGIGTERYVYC
jgi:hypothetical protein